VNIVIQGSLQNPLYVKCYASGTTIKLGDFVCLKESGKNESYKVYPYSTKENEMKKEKESVIKEKYIAYPDRFGIAVVMECLVLGSKGNWARGLTVYNEADTFDEGVARHEAKTYAVKALLGRKLQRPVKNGNGKVSLVDVSNEFKLDDAVRKLVATQCPYFKKMAKNPVLSYFERRLLFGKKDFVGKGDNKGKSFFNGCSSTDGVIVGNIEYFGLGGGS